MLHIVRVLAVGDHFFIISKMNKTSCFKSRHFINIYIINRTLHGRLGIRILSSSAESISHLFASLTRERYLQHSKIKFLSPRGHVISSIYFFGSQRDWGWGQRESLLTGYTNSHTHNALNLLLPLNYQTLIYSLVIFIPMS